MWQDIDADPTTAHQEREHRHGQPAAERQGGLGAGRQRGHGVGRDQHRTTGHPVGEHAGARSDAQGREPRRRADDAVAVRPADGVRISSNWARAQSSGHVRPQRASPTPSLGRPRPEARLDLARGEEDEVLLS